MTREQAVQQAQGIKKVLGYAYLFHFPRNDYWMASERLPGFYVPDMEITELKWDGTETACPPLVDKRRAAQ